MENRSGTNVHLVCTAILQREVIERELSPNSAINQSGDFLLNHPFVCHA